MSTLRELILRYPSPAIHRRQILHDSNSENPPTLEMACIDGEIDATVPCVEDSPEASGPGSAPSPQEKFYDEEQYL